MYASVMKSRWTNDETAGLQVLPVSQNQFTLLNIFLNFRTVILCLLPNSAQVIIFIYFCTAELPVLYEYV